MNLFLINVVFSFLSVFPGIVVVSKLFKWSITDAKSVIAGILLWDSLLIFLSIILGCISNYLNYFFSLFAAISGLITVLWVLSTLIRGKNFRNRHFALNLHELPIVSLIIVLSVYVALVMAFHPLFMEYDAIYVYLPYAKGLVATGGFFHSPFAMSDIALTRMPLMPIYYAWGLSAFGAESFRLIPFTLIILTLFAIYKVSQELFLNHKISLVAPAIFLTLPVILQSISIYSLYVDLPLMAFTVASVFCSIMALKYNETKWYLFAGLSITLSLLSKESGYIAFFISICIISLQFSRKYRLLSLLAVAFPFCAFFIKDSITYPPSNPLFIEKVIFKQVPIISLLILLSLVLFQVSNSNQSLNRNSIKKIFCLLTPTLVAVFFVLRNWFLFGAPTIVWNIIVPTNWMRAADLVTSAGSSILPSFFSFSRFDLLFDSAGLGNLYLIIMVVGFAYIVKMLASRKNLTMAAIAIWLIVVLMDWSFFFNFNFSGNEIRRFLNIAPLISITIAIGFSVFYNRISKQKTKESLSFFFAWLFCILVLIAVSIFQLKFVKLTGNYLSYIIIPKYNELFTLPTLLLSLLIPSVLIVLIYLGNKIAVSKRLSNLVKFFMFSRRRKILFSSIILVVIVTASSVPLNVFQTIADVNSSQWDSREYSNKTAVPYWEDYMPEIINYYNSSISNNYTTVSFGYPTMSITYFLNRSVIDISQTIGAYFILPVVECNNTEELLSLLYKSNIRYFLIPNEHGDFYNQYNASSSRILLLKLIHDPNYFVLIKNFTCYSLYSLLLPSSVYHTWWNCNWTERQAVIMDNSNNSESLYDYPISLNIPYVSGMDPDFKDLRFTWYNPVTYTETEIPYWIEDSVESYNATVWVRIPEILANTFYSDSNTTIHLYYGNPLVNSTSDAYSTLIAFDDFDKDAIGIEPNNWTISSKGYGDLVVTNNQSITSPNSALFYDNASEGFPSIYWTFPTQITDFKFAFWMKPTNEINAGIFYVAEGGSINGANLYFGYPTIGVISCYYNNSFQNSGTFSANNWYKIVFTFHGNVSYSVEVYAFNETLVGSIINASYVGNPTKFNVLIIGGDSVAIVTTYFDNFMVYTNSISTPYAKLGEVKLKPPS